MKLILTIPASVLLLGTFAALPAADQPAAPAVVVPAAPTRKFTEPELLEMLGWLAGDSTELSKFNFTEAELVAVNKGFATATAGKPEPYKRDEIGEQFSKYMDGKVAAARKIAEDKQVAEIEQKAAAGDASAKAALVQIKAQGAAKQSAEAATASAVEEQLKAQKAADEAATTAGKQTDSASAKFIAYKKLQKGVTALPSGLLYEIVQPGTGPSPKATDTVRVNYTGMLLNGTVFDATSKHTPADDPSEFPLNKVIPGWTEGIQKINKGGKIRLVIPAALAYGNDSPSPDIPPGSTLVFEVELIEINP